MKTRLRKLILENRSDLSTENFLRLAEEVIKMGRLSNGQYCYLTSFIIEDEEYHIASDLNKKSDRLVLYKVPVSTFNVKGGGLKNENI